MSLRRLIHSALLSLLPALLFVVLPQVAFGRTIRAASAEDAQEALDLAQPGDDVALANGIYKDLVLNLSGIGEDNRPIVLRAQRPGYVVLTGTPDIRISGANIVVQDLITSGCRATSKSHALIHFDGARHSRITTCRFNGSKLGGIPVVAFRNGTRESWVDHCVFSRTQSRSVVVVVDERALRIGPPVFNHIVGNSFEDVPPMGDRGGETIQLGQRGVPFSDLSTSTVIEGNSFVRCNGSPEVISVKTSNNFIRNNTFSQCEGELVMRHGRDNTIQNNRFQGGSGAIRLSGHGHRVTGNIISDTVEPGIRLFYGSPESDPSPMYQPVYGCTITSNSITNCHHAGLLIGDEKNARGSDQPPASPPPNQSMDMTVAPHDNLISGNTIEGSSDNLLQIIDAPNNIVRNNSLIRTGKSGRRKSSR